MLNLKQNIIQHIVVIPRMAIITSEECETYKIELPPDEFLITYCGGKRNKKRVSICVNGYNTGFQMGITPKNKKPKKVLLSAIAFYCRKVNAGKKLLKVKNFINYEKLHNMGFVQTEFVKKNILTINKETSRDRLTELGMPFNKIL
jgi:hypothetical protein